MEDLQLDIQPEGERWDPLGAPNDHEEDEASNKHQHDSFDCTHWYE